MKISKLQIFIYSIIAAIVGLCLFVYFGLPSILQSPLLIKKYENLIEEKTGFPAKVQGLNLKFTPKLAVNIDVSEISSKTDKNIDVIKIENFHYISKPLSIKPEKVTIDNVYTDFSLIQKYINSSKKNGKKSSFDLKYFPILDIKRVFVKLDKNSTVEIRNLQSKQFDSTVICKFLAAVKTPYSKYPIIVGENGYLYYSKSLYIDDLSIDFGHSRLNLSGEFTNLSAFGKRLPIDELQNAFVFFWTIKHPRQKNFIENFHNLTGTLDVNLNYSNKKLNGTCTANNLSAKFFDYKIPINLPKTVFHFENDRIWASTTGKIAGEKAFTDVEINKLFTPNTTARGTVKTKITQSLKKYYPTISISGKADATIKYQTKNRVVDIFYKLTLPQNSYIISPISVRDETISKQREITAHTKKVGNTIFLKRYTYAVNFNGSSHIFFHGNGEFKKLKGRYKPIFVTLKTNDFIPENIVPLKNKYLNNGVFRADLRFDVLKKKIFGKIELKNSYHKDFLYIKYAILEFLENEILMTSNGEFFNSPIEFEFNASNDFTHGITIKNIEILLDKFYPQKGNLNTVKSSYSENNKTDSVQTLDPSKIKVENGKIQVNQVIHPKFYLHDVSIIGKLANNIVDFEIPETEYSKGILFGKGQYDIKNHNSDIYFIASEIDSNDVATKLFKLPNQIEGLAYATLHLITKNKLNDIHANATFAVTDGFLPRLGSREIIFNKPSKLKKVLFFINKPIKFTLSKITNIDFSKPNVFYSDLKGSFTLDNEQISDVKIYSQSDYLSMFIEGGYNIENELGDICIWGRHDKIAEKKIKIFKIPLHWIYKFAFKPEHSKTHFEDKIKEIPPIKSKYPSDESFFRVEIDGNPNNGSEINIQMKDLR
jgi:hypothetical protein